MKIVISNNSTEIEEQSRLFNRPSGEVPELPPQKRRQSTARTSDRLSSTVKLSDLEQSVDGLATDIVDRIGPAIRSLRSAQLNSNKRQQQFNQLIAQELADIVGQIEAIKDSPRLPELDSLPPLEFKDVDVEALFRTSPSPPTRQAATPATQARINEIRVKIENK